MPPASCAHLGQILVSTLVRGSIVAMDSLGSHKSQRVRAAIRGMGANLFFLPTDSLDFNPIKRAFPELRPLLRREAKKAVKMPGNTSDHSSTGPSRKSASIASDTSDTSWFDLNTPQY